VQSSATVFEGFRGRSCALPFLFDFHVEDLDWEESHTTTALHELRDSKGNSIKIDGLGLKTCYWEFLHEDWCDDLGDPFSDEWDYLGQSPLTRDQLYGAHVLVFWPIKRHAEIMLSIGHDQYSLQSLVGALQDGGDIKPCDLPTGMSSAREWLDRAIKAELPGWRIRESRLLAMQGMAKLGSSDDVINLLKTFKPMLQASPDVIKV
jgi:hypothetical protein